MGLKLERAAEIIRGRLQPVQGTEPAGIDSLYGRICAEDVSAPFDLPPFDRSPLDGYAFRARDSAGASREAPAELTVVEEIAAGQWPRRRLTPGAAARLMTGAPIPAGADCVIRQEDTEAGEGRVRIFQALAPGDNFCRRGEDIPQGAPLVRAGERLNYVHAGLLAGAGFTSALVRRRVRVRLLTTGDELCPPSGESAGGAPPPPPPPGRIYSSNHALLSARLRELGVEVHLAEPCGDSGPDIAGRIKAAAPADLVITTGGVSVGDRDLVPEALELLGAEILFHGVDLKPGTPALFALYGRLPVLGFSGNPFAAATSLELLARPALAALSGDASLEPRYGRGVLAEAFNKGGGVRRFVRGAESGGVVRLSSGLHSPGALGSLRGCNCLADIPAGSGPLPAGVEVRLVYL